MYFYMCARSDALVIIYNFLTNDLFLSIESFTPNLLIVFSRSHDIKSQTNWGDSPVLHIMFVIVYFYVI
jgi:hypothetical protein